MGVSEACISEGAERARGQLEKLGGLVHLAVLVIQSAMTFTFVCGFGEESPLCHSECFRPIPVSEHYW